MGIFTRIPADPLGNTGSKTTIHKYLKELHEEEGSVARKSSVSDAVLDLAERLAARLQDEADARVTNIVAEYADRESGRASVENQLKQELADAKALAKQLETDIHAEPRLTLQLAKPSKPKPSCVIQPNSRFWA